MRSRSSIGQSDDRNFAVDSNTQFLRWTHGVPTVVPESNLLAGDRVTVRIRADRSSSLSQVESTPARQVADQGPSGRFPRQPLWLFIGTLNGPASGGHVSLHITNGNLRALRGMLGQPLNETFSYDAHTVFVLWQGRVPTLISPGQLKVGDRISVRIRAPQRYSLAQVEQVPANHVGDHEPAAPRLLVVACHEKGRAARGLSHPLLARGSRGRARASPPAPRPAPCASSPA